LLNENVNASQPTKKVRFICYQVARFLNIYLETYLQAEVIAYFESLLSRKKIALKIVQNI